MKLRVTFEIDIESDTTITEATTVLRQASTTFKSAVAPIGKAKMKSWGPMLGKRRPKQPARKKGDVVVHRNGSLRGEVIDTFSDQPPDNRTLAHVRWTDGSEGSFTEDELVSCKKPE